MNIVLFKETSDSSEKYFLYVGKDAIHPGDRNAVSITIVPECILQRQWWERAILPSQQELGIFSETASQDTQLDDGYIEIVNITLDTYEEIVSFPVCVPKEAGVLMGGPKNLLKSVAGTMSLCHTWPSLFQVTWTVSCDSSRILFRVACIHLICCFMQLHGKIRVWVCAYLTGNVLQLYLVFMLSSSTHPHPLAEKSSLFTQLCPNPHA